MTRETLYGSWFHLQFKKPICLVVCYKAALSCQELDTVKQLKSKQDQAFPSPRKIYLVWAKEFISICLHLIPSFQHIIWNIHKIYLLQFSETDFFHYLNNVPFIYIKLMHKILSTAITPQLSINILIKSKGKQGNQQAWHVILTTTYSKLHNMILQSNNCSWRL